MRPLAISIPNPGTPEALVESFGGMSGTVLLRSALFDPRQARYSFVAARPFLTFRSAGSRCELISDGEQRVQFGNPWRVLDGLMARYELLEEMDLPFPWGGCFGFWGYDLKQFVEPRLGAHAINDLELPDCHVGFYDSLVVFDHQLDQGWILSTGLQVDGSRSLERAEEQAGLWKARLPAEPAPALTEAVQSPSAPRSNITREAFLHMVRTAQDYIRQGDIYQVNLSQRFCADYEQSGWNFYRRLAEVSPAPFSAYLDCGGFQVISSSPELFLRLSGPFIQTRPIKGTRPRSADPIRDAQLTYELQTSPKEMSELVMITDLLRNDLGRVCEFGSVQVPELVRIERYPHVQHLVSTVEGRLRSDATHFSAFASCFPGGSITGAPKIRAMEIIDELEPATRGPYTGAIGYLGFNRESQLSIAIRTAVRKENQLWFHAGAGIVADSDPESEYEETLAKAAGFFSAIRAPAAGAPAFPQR
jgi:para-aminobenzoate synthetase component I